MKIFKTSYGKLLFVVMLLITASFVQGATKTSTSTGGNWNAAATWSGNVVPLSTDDVVIAGGATVTVSVNATCKSVKMASGATAITGTLSVNSGVALTVTTSVSISDGKSNVDFYLSGLGSINCTSLTINTPGTVPSGSAINAFIIHSSIAALTVSGNLTLNGNSTTGSGKLNNPQFDLQNGTTTVSGSIRTITSGATSGSGPTCSLITTTAPQTGKLVLSNAAPFILGTGFIVNTFDFTGTGATVIYSGSSQTALVKSYNNLTLSGSGAKTFAATPTVNGVLSMEGTATITVTTGAVTYGASATLKYNTATSRTEGAEWISPFAATGGVVIANTGTITLAGANVLGASVPLTINSGATLNTGNFQLTFGGNFVNGGTFSAGSSPIVIANTMVAQSIAGFTTTGLVSMTKTAGTATFQGNVGGAGLTINGTGGSLNLGTGLTHTFSGTWTRTNGTLDSGSSTLLLGSGYSGTGGTFTANTGNVTYYASAAQSIAPVTYNNLTLSGTSAKTFPAGTTTVNGVLSMEGTATTTVTGTLTLGTSSTLHYKGGAAQTTGNEFITPFPGSGGVKINNANGVTLDGPRSLGANPLTIGDVVSNSVFNDDGNQLTATGTLNLTSGILKLGSATATTFPAFGTRNISAGTTVEYAATTTQTIKGISYSNLTISGSGNNSKVSDADITVDGILNLNSSNASSMNGCLDMSSFTLNMGVSSTTTGTGDVTGIVKRTNASFANNIAYSFGNQYTTVTFSGISGGTKPGWLSCKITLGAAPSWKTSAIQRVYTFAEDVASTDKVGVRLHYLSSELNSNLDASLVFYDAHNGPTFATVHEHGKTNNDATLSFVELSGITSSYLAPSASLDNKQWSLANYSSAKNTWNGLSTDWTQSTNWTAGHAPLTTEDVLIPSGKLNYPSLTLNVEMKTLEIESGASVTTGTFNITINGSTGAWSNNGTFNSSGTGTLIFSNGNISNVVSISGSGTNNFTNLTVNANTFLQPAAGSYIKIAGTLTAGSGSIIDLKTTTNTIEYNGSGQTIINPVGPGTDIGYSNLIINSTGTTTLPAALNVMRDFTQNGGTTIAGSTIDILENVILNSGTFNASGAAINISGNWSNNGATYTPGTSTVTFDNTSSAQSINGTATSQTFYDLVVAKTAQTLSVSGSTNTIYINNLTEISGNFTAPATLTINGNATLTAGTLTAGSNTTTITGNTTLTSGVFIPGSTTNFSGNITNNGATFTDAAGNVNLNGSAAHTIGGTTSNTFNNLTINNTAGISAGVDQTVNGILYLQSGNPSSSKGSLDMGSNTLSMGIAATTNGVGDVTGIVKRNHVFSGNTAYTFGNPNTTITFVNVTGGIKPAWISCKIAIGTAPGWRSEAVNRIYSFAQDGTGTDRTVTKLHYLDSELHGTETDETKLVFWDAYTGPDFTNKFPRSKSNNDATNNWVELNGMAINFIATATTLDVKQWGLSYTNVTKITWTGNGSPTYTGDWSLPGNWNGGVPLSTDDVLIPASLPSNTNGYPTRNLNASSVPSVAKTIEIEAGASLSVNSYDITVFGSTGAWVNNGTFNAGTGMVIFDHNTPSENVSIAGSTNFNNVTVSDGTTLVPGSNNIMRIAGAFSLSGTGILNAATNINTVEYNGASQTVKFPNGTTTGYYNLILSGSGTKTMPSQKLDIHKDFTLSGTSQVNANQDIAASGNINIGSGTSLNASTYGISLGGNWSNSGSFSAGSGTVTFSGSSAQTISGSNTFNNLTVNNTFGVTAGANQVVNGILNLQSANASSVKGSLDLGTNTLLMGGSATNTGIGDVTGIVKRTAILHSVVYTLGNPYTAISFTSTGTLPSEMSLRTTIGTAPSWKTAAIQRTYEFIQTGASGVKSTITGHYLDSELNENNESSLSFFKYEGSVASEIGRSDYDITNNAIALSGLDVSVFPASFGTSVQTIGSTGIVSSTWTGTTSTNWSTPSNWYNANVPSPGSNVIIPDAGTTNWDPTIPDGTSIASINLQNAATLNAASGAQLTLTGTGLTWNNDGGTFNANGSNVTITNTSGASVSGSTNFHNLTINSGVIIALGSGSITGISGTVTNYGVMSTTSQGPTTVNYNGGDQTIVVPNPATNRYSTLILSGSGTKTMPVTAMTIGADFNFEGTASATARNSITILGNLSLAAGTTFTSGSFSHSIAGNLIDNGALVATGSTITLNGTSAQTISGTENPVFTNLNITNSTATVTSEVNLRCLGDFANSGTLDMSTNTLAVTGTLTNTGTLKTQNSSSIPIPSGKAWAGLVEYNGSSSQTAVTGTYNNLTINNIAGATASGDITVNGTLSLPKANPTATNGSLELVSNWGSYPSADNAVLGTFSSYTLFMGASSITSGIGDVTGIVSRNYQLSAGNSYSFGNQYTTISFTPGASPTIPSGATVVIKIGIAPAGKPEAVQRSYQIIPSGGSNCFVNANFHYLDSELQANTESNLVTWDYDLDGGYITPDEHGRSAYDFTNNYIGFSNVPISYFIYVDPTHKWRTIFELGDHASTQYLTWRGTYSTDWLDGSNWFPSGNVPDATSFVTIPDATLTNYSPTLPATAIVNTLLIENGGVLTMGNSTLTIANSLSGGWEDQNASGNDPETSTVIFANSGASVSGVARFYNLTINAGANLTNSINSTVKIAGTFTKTGAWYTDVTSGMCTVEYNGDNQTIVLSDGSPTYHNLILSGSGTKTLPSAAMTIDGDFTIGTGVTTTLSNDLAIRGNFSNSATSFTNNAGTVSFIGTAAQSIIGSAATSFNNLTLNNAFGVTLSDVDATVNGTLTFSNGSLTTGTNLLTIGSAGIITGASSTKYVNGKLARVFDSASSKSFPIANGGNYRPVTLTYSALTGTSTVIAEQFEGSLPGTLPSNATLFADRYWTVTESGGSSYSYNLTLDPTGFSPTHTVVMLKNDGATTANATTSPNYTNTTGFTTFGSFGLGESEITSSTTVDAKTITYGNSTVNLTATVSPVPTGGTIQFYIDGATVGSPVNVNISTGTASYSYNPATLTAGNHSIAAQFSGHGDFLVSSKTSATLTVGTKTLTITASNQVKCFGSTSTFAGNEFTSLGLQNSDAISSVTLTSAGASAGAAAGTYSIVPSAATGIGLTNYTIGYTNGTLTVDASSVGGLLAGGTTICSGNTSGTLTLSNYVGTILKWQSSVSPFSSWTDISNTSATYTSGALTQTTQFRAVVQNGSCSVSYSSSTTVTVDPVSAGGTVSGGVTQIYMGQSTGDLILSGYTGTVTKWQHRLGAGSWEDITNTTNTFNDTPNAVGIWEYKAIVQSGTCSETTSASYSVEVIASNAGAVTGGNTPICLGSATGTMTLAGYTGTIVKWQKHLDSGSWSDIAITTTTYSETPVSAGTWEYRAVVLNAQEMNSAPTTIVVNPPTVAGAVAGGTNVCTGSTSGILSLSGQTGSVVRWESSISPFTSWTPITNISITYTSGTLTETTKFRAVVQSGACSLAYATETTVTVDPVSVGGSLSGGTSPIYLGQSTGDITLSGQTGTVVKWQERLSIGTWEDVVNTTTTYNDTEIITGTWEYRAVVQSGSCPSTYSSTKTIDLQPNNSGAVTGGNTPVCLGTSTGTLTVSGYTGTIQKWQKLLLGGSWSDITNTATTYSEVPSSAGTWQYRAVVRNASDMNSAAVTIVVDPTTVEGSVSGGTTICSGSTSGLLTLSGHTGSIVKWQKSVSPFSSWSDISNTSATYTSGALTQTTQFRAVVQSGSCLPVASSSSTVTVDPVSVGGSLSGGTTPIFLSQSTGTITLSGNTGNVIQWQKRLDGGSWISITNTNTTYSETPASAGTWEYRATVQSGVCSTAYSSSVSIVVQPNNAGSVTGGNTPICLGSSSGTLTLSGNTGTIVKWQKLLVGGSWSDINITATTYSETPSSAGTWQYRAVVHNATDMNSAAVTIIVDPTSAGGSVSGGTTICSGSTSGLLTLSGHTGTVVKWQKSVDPFSSWSDISNTSTTYTSGALTQTTQFRAVVQSGVCSIENSAVAIVTVDPLSVGGTVSGGSSTIFLGQSTGTISLTGQTGTVVKWQERLGTGTWIDEAVTANSYSDVPNAVGTWEFRAVVQSGTCSTAYSSSVFIEVLTSAAGAVTGGTSPVCLGSPTGTMTLAEHTGTIVKWQKNLDGGSWSDITNTTTTHSETPGSAGTWEYRAVVLNSGEMNSAPTTIVVDPLSVGGTVSGGTTVCYGSTSGVLTLAGQTGTVVRWESSVSPFNSWSSITNTSATYTSGTLTETTQFRAVVKSGNCTEATSSSTTVTVNPTSVGGSLAAGVSEIFLTQSTGAITLSGNTGSVIKWQERLGSGGSWVDVNNTTTSYTDTEPIVGTWYYRAVVQSGVCSAANSSEISIVVKPNNAGTVSGGSSPICFGTSTGTLTLSGYTGTIVKWQKLLVGGSWSDFGSTLATQSETPTSAGTWEYRAVVRNASDMNSGTVTIVVDATTAGGSVTGGSTICSGNNSGLLTLSGHTGSVVKWQSSVSPFSSWSDISSTSTTYTSGALTQTTQFRAVVLNGSCVNENSASTTVTVDPISVGGTLSAGFNTLYVGQSTGAITLSGKTGVVLKWQQRVDGGTWVDVSNTTATYTDNAPTVGTWDYRAVVQSGTCSAAYSSVATITVLASNAGAITGGSSPICLSSSTGTLTLSGYTGTIVKWQKLLDGGSWIDINNTSATYSETPSSAGTWQYRAMVHNASDMYSVQAIIDVDPTTVGGSVAGGSTICSGNSSGLLTLSGHLGSILKWQSAVSPFTSWTDIANYITTYSPGVLTQTTKFRAVIQSGSCLVENSAATTVSVDPVSVGGNISSTVSQIFLGQSTGTLSLAGHVGTVAKWQQRLGTGSWTDVANTTNSFSATPNAVGFWEYRVVVQSGLCSVTNSTSYYQEVLPASEGTVSGGTSPLCLGGTTGTLTLSGHTGTIVKWQKHLNGGSWIDISNTSDTYSETPASAGTWEYRAIVHNVSDMISAPATILVNPTSIGGSVTGGSTICSGSASGLLTLSGQTGSVVKWQSSVDPFTSWTDISNTSTTYTSGALTQTTQFRAVVQSGVCTIENSAAAIVTVDPVSVGGTVSGGNGTVYLGQSIGTISLTGQTGNVIKWQERLGTGTWIDEAVTANSYSDVPNAVGTWEFRAVVQSGTCSTAYSSSVFIEVLTSAAGAVTGGTSPICFGSATGTMTLAGFTGSILKWQKQLDGGVWSDILNSSETYSETPSSAGTWEYRAVVHNIADMTSAPTRVVVDPVTAGGSVTGGTTICSGNTSGLLSLSGNTGLVIKWQSSVAPFTTWTDIASTSTTYTSGALTQTTQFRAVVQSGSCSVSNAALTIVTVDPVSVGGSLTGGTTPIYMGQSTGTFTLTGYTGTIIKWQERLGSGSWVDVNNTTTTFSDIPNAVGVWEYRAVVQSGTCSVSNSSSVFIQVLASAAGTVTGGSTPICSGTSTGTMTLSGYSGTIVKWQKRLDNGTWSDITNTATTYSEVPASAGTWEYRAVVHAVSDMFSALTTIVVDATTVGGAVTGGAAICSGNSSGLLTLSGQTGTVMKWQKSISPFNTWIDIANTSTTYTSGILSETTKFRAVVQNGSCSILNSSETTVTVDPVTVGGIVSGGSTICSGNTSGLLSLSGHTGTIVKWQSAVSPFIVWADISSTGTTYTSGTLTQTTQFRAVLRSGSCTISNSESTTVTVDPVSVGGALSGGDSPIYLGQTIGTISLSGQTGTIVKWQERLGNTAWFDEAETSSSYSDIPNAVGTWEYRVVVQSGTCSVTNSSSVYIDVLPSDAGAVTGTTAPICLGSSTGTMTLAGYTGTIVKWQKMVNDGAWTDINNTATTYSEIPASAGTWEYRAVIRNLTDMTSAPAKIDVDPTSVGGSVSGGTTICSGSTSGLLTLTGLTGSVVKWQSAVYPFSSWTDIVNTSSSYTSGALTQTTQFRAVVQNGSCSTAVSFPTTVNVDPASVGGVTSGGNSPISLGQSIGTISLSGQTGTILKWQERLGSGAWIDEAETSFSYSDIPNAAGTWEYRVVVQSGTCPVSNSSSVFINVLSSSAGAVTGNNGQICLGGSTGILTLAGYTGAILKWQKMVDEGTWTDISNTTATYSEIPASAGTWEYRAVIQGTSEMNSAPVKIVVNPTSLGGAVSGGTTICSGNTSGMLTLSGHTGTVQKWQSAVSPFTNWTDIANSTASFSSGNLTQTTHFRAVVQSGNCNVVNSGETVVTVNPLSVGGTISAGVTQINLGQNTGSMILSGYTGTIVKWQERQGTGSWIDVLNTTNTFTDTPNILGMWEFRAVVQSGSCSVSNSASCFIEVLSSNAGAVTGGATPICLGSSTGTMTLSGYAGTIVKWQKHLDGGIWSDINNTSSTFSDAPLTSGTWEYRAVISNGGTLTSAPTTIVVTPATVGGTIAGGTSICFGSSSGLLTLSGYSGSIVRWQSSIAPYTTWSNIANTTATYTSGSLIQTTKFRAVIQSGNCSQVNSTEITVNVLPLPVPIINGPANSMVGATGKVYTTESGMSGYNWTISSGGTITSGGGSGDNTITVTWKSVGAQTVKVNYLNTNGCSASTASIKSVNVRPATKTTLFISGIFANDKVYNGNTDASLTGSPKLSGIVSPDNVTLEGSPTATFVSPNAADNITVSVTGYTLGGTEAEFYTLSQPELSANITKATLVITPNSANKSYRSLKTYLGTEFSLTGKLFGTDVLKTVSLSSAGDAVSSFAGNYEISAGAAVGSGLTNYAISYAKGTLTVNKAPVIVTAKADKKVYDRTSNSSVTPEVTGILTPDVMEKLPIQSFDNQKVGKVKTLTASGLVINDGNGGNNYAVSYVANANGEITPAMVTPAIKANSKCFDGTTVAILNTQSLSGVLAPEVVLLQVASSNFDNVNPGIGKTVTALGLTLSGADAGNYLLTTTSAATTADINPLPGNAGIISGQTALCGGSQGVAYSITSIANATGYVWSVPTGATIVSGSGTSSIKVNFSPFASSGNISVYGTNDCGKGLSANLAISVTPLPAAANTISGGNSVCQGSTGLVFSVAQIANATTYYWTLPAGATIISGDNTNRITIDLAMTTTSGIITVTGSNNCGKGAVSPNFNLTVNPIPPKPVISAVGVSLMSNAPMGNQWFFSPTKSGSGSSISGATNQSYTPSQNGYYWIVVTLNNCVSAASNELYRIMEGEATIYNAYPVPNNGEFTISITTSNETTYSIDIFDTNGSKILEMTSIVINGEYLLPVNLQPISSGTYTIVFRSNAGTTTRKILILK